MNHTPPLIEIGNIPEKLESVGSSYQSSLFNLIVYSPNAKRTEILYSIFTRVAEKFPCRILLIEKINDEDANEVKVSVSKEKFGKRNSQVICDLIRITCSMSQMQRIPFIILPNILADLPIYLIWGDDPTRTSKTLQSLQSLSMRLIFDAAWIEDLTAFSARMVSFLKTLKIEAMDISWAYLTGWKEILIHVFDSQAKIENLQYCKKMTIKYPYETPQDALQAIYLQGFIASKMNWELTAEEISHEHQKALCYRYKNHDINVILIQEPKGLKKEAISELEIVGKDGTIYSFYTSKNPSKVILHVSSIEACEMPCTFSIPDFDRGFNFLKEIFYQLPEASYAQTLNVISKVNWEK